MLALAYAIDESGSVSTPVVPKIMTVQTLHGILYDRKDADKYFIFDVREPEEVNTRKRLQGIHV